MFSVMFCFVDKAGLTRFRSKKSTITLHLVVIQKLWCVSEGGWEQRMQPYLGNWRLNKKVINIKFVFKGSRYTHNSAYTRLAQTRVRVERH